MRKIVVLTTAVTLAVAASAEVLDRPAGVKSGRRIMTLQKRPENIDIYTNL